MPYYRQKRKKGEISYKVQITATIAPGEHRTVYATAHSLAEAKKKEEELRQLVSVDAGVMTIEEGARRYLADQKLRVKPTTFNSSKFVIEKQILPFIGSYKVTAVSPQIVRNLQNQWLARGLKPTYLNLLNAKLSAIFNYFIRFYGLSQNPVKSAGPLGNRFAKEMQFWTLDEYKQFYRGLDPIEDLSYCVLFQVLFFTGMRIGEALALFPSDIDLQHGFISITKTYARIEGKDILQTPKTHNSVRKVSIPKFLIAMLKEFISHLPSSDTRLFFQVSKWSLWRKMRTVCRKTGVKVIRIHDLRHSAVALLIEEGVSIMEISKRCGHRSPDVTYKVYAHLYPNKEESIAKILDNIHGKNGCSKNN